MQVEKNKATVRRFIEAMNNREFAILDQLLAPNVVRHCQATPGIQVRSLDDFKEFLRRDFEAFPDAHQELHILIAEDDKVAVYLTYRGTQMGPMGPFPASGKTVEANFLGILRLEGDTIAEIWIEWDNLNILTQLGHFPRQ